MKDLTIGRIVHYVMSNGKHRAAIVTEVLDKEKGQVHLTVFPIAGETVWNSPESGQPGQVRDIYPSDLIEPGTWHWIEFVE